MGENQQTYEQFINEILNARGRFGCTNKYHERHHIVPKCLGGTDDVDNLIDLYAKEHFIAHKLLALENPHNSKLQYVWWMMASIQSENQERYKCTPEEYEQIKIIVAEKRSEDAKGEKNPMYGKHRIISEETRKKMSAAHAGAKHHNYGKHPIMSEETKQKISKALKGHKGYWEGKKFSESHKQKIREAVSGENSPMYGKHLSEATKQKISKKNSGANHARCRAVLCVETGEVFWGAMEVENKTKIDHSAIAKCCKGKRKTAGGYHWQYV